MQTRNEKRDKNLLRMQRKMLRTFFCKKRNYRAQMQKLNMWALKKPDMGKIYFERYGGEGWTLRRHGWVKRRRRRKTKLK